MLDRLQRQLSDTYQADPGYDVRDFLITDPQLARVLSGDNVLTASGETLLVAEDENGLAMSLYLEGALLERVESRNPMHSLDGLLLDAFLGGELGLGLDLVQRAHAALLNLSPSSGSFRRVRACTHH